MHYGCVYLILNIENQKMYVGQTTESIPRRWGRHVQKAQANKPGCGKLYNAIRKYGPQSFTYHRLATASDRPGLDALESAYIEKFDAVNSGYNICPRARVPTISAEGKRKLREAVIGKPHNIGNICLNLTPEQHLKRVTSLRQTWNDLGIKPTPPKKRKNILIYRGATYLGLSELARSFGTSRWRVYSRIRHFHPDLISQKHKTINFDAIGFDPIPPARNINKAA